MKQGESDGETCLFCRDCAHSNYFVCARPDAPAKKSLVTGEVEVSTRDKYCDDERKKVSKYLRLLGNNRCGIEAKYFLASQRTNDC